jgi:PEP-CTERM motif
MVNDRNIEPTTPAPSGTRKRSSKAAKLVQAAALAAVLVPLGSVAVETAPITLGYSGAGFNGTETNNRLFDFGPYEFRLFFENLASLSFFQVTVNNQVTDQDAVDSRLTNFPGYLCVPIDPTEPTGNPCVDFVVTAPLFGPNTWTGSYDVTIAWDFDTDPTFPNVPGDRIRILHDEGRVSGNAFISDITTDGSYFSGIDPAIGGRDDNFQTLMVFQSPLATDAVPEPATLFLVTTGVSGLLYRRRRKRQDSAGG